MTSIQRILMVAVLLALGACQRSEHADSMASGSASAPEMARAEADADAAASEDAVQLGAMLAYEHAVAIALDADGIAARAKEVRTACDSGKFGPCVALNVQQNDGDDPSAMLVVRIVPAGVEPMIALASAGGRLGTRSTQAEDLAVMVRDNTLAQDRLAKEMARLQEFQQRPELAVADMIALARQLSETEAQLQALQQDAAQHRRRIDTQLLTLNFHPPGSQSGRNEIVQAVRDFGGILSMGTAWMIRAAAFLIPLALAVLLVVGGVRRWRRRQAH